MEQPVLRLGLIGFAETVTAQLGKWLTREVEGWPQWSIAAFDKADAWLVNGRAISEFDNDSLTLQTGLPTQPWLKINPADMSRPIAFAGKLPSALEANERVDLSQEASIRKQLQSFEAWLRPLRAQFALGADLVEREAELRPGIYQITLQGRFLAILDLFKWRAGILPTARPVDFAQAVWDHRPPSADNVPAGFIQMPIAQLMWIYATRTRADVLPARYRAQAVYLRRLPQIPVGWMQEEHLVLLRELRACGGPFNELLDRTGLGAVSLARTLAALYFAGSITTNPRSAHEQAGGVSPLGTQSSLPQPSNPGQESQRGFSQMSGFTREHSRYLTFDDLTAPAPLDPR